MAGDHLAGSLYRREVHGHAVILAGVPGGRARTGSAAPDFSPPPAPAADARGLVDDETAFAEGVHALADVDFAEMALAKRALLAGMGTAAFDAAKSRRVPLDHPRAVIHVSLEVDVLADAAFARADGIVAFDDVGV
jgi:hypothetical protein